MFSLDEATQERDEHPFKAHFSKKLMGLYEAKSQKKSRSLNKMVATKKAIRFRRNTVLGAVTLVKTMKREYERLLLPKFGKDQDLDYNVQQQPETKPDRRFTLLPTDT